MLVFGIAFEIPVFVVLLNLAGVVSGRALGAHRAWIVIGCFLFAAIATPSTDPFTMTFMAIPMVLLFLISEVIARLNDRRRGRRHARRARRRTRRRSCDGVATGLDPFDLPDWLGEGEVTWASDASLRSGIGWRATCPGPTEPDLACDLLAVDEAYPAPVVDADTRTRAHQAWRHGQVLLLRQDDRLTLALPGTSFTPDLVLDALTRLARAVGAEPAVLLGAAAAAATAPERLVCARGHPRDRAADQPDLGQGAWGAGARRRGRAVPGRRDRGARPPGP